MDEIINFVRSVSDRKEKKNEKIWNIDFSSSIWKSVKERKLKLMFWMCTDLYQYNIIKGELITNKYTFYFLYILFSFFCMYSTWKCIYTEPCVERVWIKNTTVQSVNIYSFFVDYEHILYCCCINPVLACWLFSDPNNSKKRKSKSFERRAAQVDW